MSTNEPLTRPAVTAIIVAHDGARWLPALVRALKSQTRPIDRVVGVDTASRDGSGGILGELIGQDAVFGMGRSAGFGEAVAAALRHAPRRQLGVAGPREWIWLLHDDCEPAPDALERLLQVAGRDRSAAVVGPKVLDAQDRRTLREVGIAIDRAGRRVTGIDPGEIDQGQHDHKRTVMAVSSAGMLVRRDVWERLGGFDPNLKLFRDDLDFCWRVQAAGMRVQVATHAILYHWELAGRRRRDAQGGSVRLADRSAALYVLAVNLPLLTMLRTVGGCVVGSLVRALYFLLTKQLDQSAAYALSVAGLFAHPIRVFKARRRRARGFAEGYYAVRIFIRPAHTAAKITERIAGLVSGGRSGGHNQTGGEEPEEDAQFVDQPSVVRRIIGQPGFQLFLALLLITLIATRRLLGTSRLGGGSLVPAWGSALALWQEYLAGFHAVSVGTAASAPPYLAVVASLATLLGGQAWLAVEVLLLGCVPLAGITAYFATRRIVTSTPARLLLAASYALLPVATGAVAAGRLGTAVAFTLLPLIAASAGRVLTAPPRQARRAAWATGLFTALAAAFAPLTWVLGLVFAAGALAARRWLVAVRLGNAAIVAVTPFFLLFPWSLHLLSSPSSFLLEAGVTTANLTTHGLSATALLALSPGGPGVPPVWVTAGFALALAALVLPGRRFPVVIGGWAVAVAGLLAAVTLSRVSVTPPGGGPPADGWPGVALALAALGLLVAAAPAADWLAGITRNDSAQRSSGTSSAHRGARYGWAQRTLATVALTGAATAPLLVAAYWVNDGVRGPVGRVSAPLMPAFVTASPTSGAQYRTLILRPDGPGLDYQVVRQADPSLGEPELGISAAATAALSRQVAALGAPDEADTGDPGLALGSFGIKWVMMPAPVDPALASRLDAALGLVALNNGPSYDLWQVTGPVGQVRVVAPSGATTVLSSGNVDVNGVAAPASGGTLILAEPYGGWTAELNGRALKPVAKPVDGWAQGFVLPPGGGQLSVTRNDLPRLLSLILELVAALAVIAAALPGKRVDRVEEAEALAALREARANAAGRRAVRGAGQGRPRASRAGRRAADHEASGAHRLRLDPPGYPSQQPAIPDSPGAEPALDTGEQDWLDELLRRNGLARPARPDTSRPPTDGGSRPPWESEPRLPPEHGPRVAATSTGAHPASRADADPVPRDGSPSAWGTDARSAWESDAPPAARTGPQHARSGGQRQRTGGQHAVRTGARPTFTPATSASPPAPAQPAFTQPGPVVTPADMPPESGSAGGQPTFTPAGEGPVVRSGPQPVQEPPGHKPPWESGEWDAVPGQGSGDWPAVPPPGKPERHSHRGGRHGKPGRKRGPGDRSPEDGAS